MNDTAHLEQRRNGWYAVLYIPPSLRERAGKVKFRQSLNTTDLKVAIRRKGPVLEEFRRRIDLLARGQEDKNRRVYDLALEFRLASQAAGMMGPEGHEEHAADFFMGEALAKAGEVAERQGEDVGLRFKAIAQGKATLLCDLYPKYLDYRRPDVRPAQLIFGEKCIKDYIAWAGQGVTVEETTRRKAGDYITALRTPEASKKTVANKVAELVRLFDWLSDQGYKDRDSDNPWTGHRLSNKVKRGSLDKRRSWNEEELEVLLRAPKANTEYGPVLYDAMRLALLTGARLTELTCLRCDGVLERDDGLWITIGEAKTEAGKRTVPVHAAIAPVVLRRMKASEDGYLFSGLLAFGPNEVRGGRLSGVFTDFRRKLGLKDDRTVFHSFRRNFIELLEGNDVPLATAKILVGHKRSDITYGTYSSGQRVKLRAVIDGLAYSEPLMKLIRA